MIVMIVMIVIKLCHYIGKVQQPGHFDTFYPVRCMCELKTEGVQRYLA
jgi:hypothetical protein